MFWIGVVTTLAFEAAVFTVGVTMFGVWLLHVIANDEWLQ